MDIQLSMQPTAVQQDAALKDLAICNAKSAPYGLALSAQEVQGLVERRLAALRATGRVEFGSGILRSLVFAFCDSPYLTQDRYEESLAELQDMFYRFKEETDEQIGDDELLEAMRQAFDNTAQGSLGALADLPAKQLFELVGSARQDGNADWSDSDAYEKEDEKEEPRLSDELDRVREGEGAVRPDNDYTAGFYDDYREVFRIANDIKGRIGGSSLG